MPPAATDQAVQRDRGQDHGARGERAPVDRHVEVGEAAVDGAQEDRAQDCADDGLATALSQWFC